MLEGLWLLCLGVVCVTLVDEQRLDNHEDLVHVGAHEVVKLVPAADKTVYRRCLMQESGIEFRGGGNAQHPVHHLDQQVPLLVLQRWRHEQRQNLVEEGAGAEGARVVGDLAQGDFAHGRRAVFDLQHELHDATWVIVTVERCSKRMKVYTCTVHKRIQLHSAASA